MPIIDAREKISAGATNNVSDRYLLNMERLYRGESRTPVIDSSLRIPRLAAIRLELKRRKLKPLPAQAKDNIITRLGSDDDMAMWYTALEGSD